MCTLEINLLKILVSQIMCSQQRNLYLVQIKGALITMTPTFLAPTLRVWGLIRVKSTDLRCMVGLTIYFGPLQSSVFTPHPTTRTTLFTSIVNKYEQCEGQFRRSCTGWTFMPNLVKSLLVLLVLFSGLKKCLIMYIMYIWTDPV